MLNSHITFETIRVFRYSIQVFLYYKCHDAMLIYGK